MRHAATWNRRSAGAGVPAVAFVADEHDARRLEAHADDPGTAFVADHDAAGAGAAAARLLQEGPTEPVPAWDAQGFVAALAAVLPPAPRLA